MAQPTPFEPPINELLQQPEGPRLAFLRERARLDEVAETLAAMANGQGGSIVLGVAGRSKARVEGVSNVDAGRDLLIEAALACTPPLILPLPIVVRHEDAPLVLAIVPAGLPQVYAVHGKYLRREGGTNQPIAPDALRRLLLERGDVSWERSIPDDAAPTDLDDARIMRYAERVGPDAVERPLELLYRRGCVVRSTDGSNNGYRPTNAGLLLFSRDVASRMPQAEITLVQYRGLEMSDEFEREDIHDTLPEAARRAERWLFDHMRKGSRMIGLEREDWTQFPPGCVREALVNAIAHRDYGIRGEGVRVALFADRLEVYSPGRLPGHVTVANIAEERYSRNESLVQVLADLGLIERLGYGINRMLRQMAEAGLPAPSFRETAAGFLVTLQGRPIAPLEDGLDTREWVRMGLNERQIAALIHLSEQRRITNRDLQELNPDVSAETIRRDLADLVERGMLLKVGEKRATYYILK
ncbi:MAG: DeoR family transcriptional regulator [Oscillochloris sp.]|nr:DeoR family transcriptional regulator [Oscillochloris sp.]